MPMDIEHEGTKLTVYTQAELDTAVAGAKTGLLSEEDARKMVDSAAAKARREAESKLGELQAELAKAGNSAERVTALEKQIAEQAGKLTGSEKTLQGIKALAKGGLSIEQAEFLLQHPKFAEAKFDSDEGVTAALESAKSLGLTIGTPAAAPPPPNGGGGSPTPPAGPQKPEGLGASIMAHYQKQAGA